MADFFAVFFRAVYCHTHREEMGLRLITSIRNSMCGLESMVLGLGSLKTLLKMELFGVRCEFYVCSAMRSKRVKNAEKIEKTFFLLYFFVKLFTTF